MEYKRIDEPVLDEVLEVNTEEGEGGERVRTDSKEGAKYVAIVQAVTCFAIILIFLAMKYGLPELYIIAKDWYLDLVSNQIPVNYFSEFFRSLFG